MQGPETFLSKINVKISKSKIFLFMRAKPLCPDPIIFYQLLLMMKMMRIRWNVPFCSWLFLPSLSSWPATTRLDWSQLMPPELGKCSIKRERETQPGSKKSLFSYFVGNNFQLRKKKREGEGNKYCMKFSAHVSTVKVRCTHKRLYCKNFLLWTRSNS